MRKVDYLGQARLCYENGDYNRAGDLLHKAAVRGNADAMFSLGIMHLIGQGVSKDIGMAKSYILKAKQSDHPVAMFYWNIIKELTQDELDADKSFLENKVHKFTWGDLHMLEKLQKIVRRYTDDQGIIITSDMTLLTDLGLNSYELVELVCKVEEEFDVEIPDRAIGGFKTVQDVMGYIIAHE